MLQARRERIGSLQILLIEDDADDARLFEEHLREITKESGVQWEEDLAAGIWALDGGSFDVIALGLELPDSEGASAVEQIRELAPDIPIVVVTGPEDENLALSMLEVGATECIQKSELAPSLLARTLRWAVERASMEQTLRERERALRSVTENISQGIYRSAPEEGLIYANQAFANLFGYESPEEALADDPASLYADADRRCELRQILRTDGQFESAEVEFRRKDGSTFTGLLSGTVFRDATGEIVSFDGAVQDITERIKAERELGESEERYRTLAEHFPNGAVGVYDRDLRYTLAEGELLGEHLPPAGRLEGDRMPDIFPESTASDLEPMFRAAVEDGVSGEVETTFGGRIWRVWATPLRNPDGEIFAGLSYAQDITEQKEREEALRQQRNLLEQTQRLAGGWQVNTRTEEVSWSEEVYRIHDLSPGTQVGLDEMIGFFEPEVQEELQEAFERCVQEHEAYDLELPLTTASGERRWVRTVGAPSGVEDGDVVQVSGALQDITDRKEAKEALREREERLRGLANSIPGVLFQFEARSDGTRGFSFISGRIKEILGLNADQENFFEEALKYSPDSYREALLQSIDEAIEEKSPWTFEAPFDKPSGERIWLRAISTPDARGEDLVFNGVLLDVTERKEAEEALKESEELHRATLSNITDTVLLTDADGDFTYVCPNVGYIFGRTEQEVEELGSISALLGSDPAEEHEFGKRQEISNVEQSVVDSAGKRHDLLVNIRRVAIQNARRMYTCRDITERKEAEEALREREEYLSVTLQSIGDAVVATDRDGRITEMNPVAERLAGWDQEEAKGKLLDDVLALHSARTGERVESPAERVLRGGRNLGLANRTILTARDGTEYQIADSAAPIQGNDGELRGVVLVFRDVTEEYERRRRMERQNDLFAKAQDLANVGGWEYDVRSETAVWTEEVYQIHGLPPDVEVSPERSLQSYHEEDRPVIEEAFTRAVEEAEPYDEELRLITAEGDERWVRTRGEPQTEDGDVVRVRGTIQDVTDRKKYEEGLERMTNLLRLAEEMTDVGGWSVDVRGERPYQAEWTDQLYEIFGLSPREEPPTEEVFDFYHPEDRDRHRQAVYRAEQTGEGWDQELRLVRADGTERWVHNIGVPITDEGEVVEIRGAIQDVTERKSREKRLEEMRDRMVLALDQTSSIVFEIDLTADQVSRMGAYEKFFGMPSEEVETPEEHVKRAVHPEDRADFREFYDELAAGERRSGTFEYRTNPERGEVRWIRDIVHRIEGEERLLGLARDVTVRKEQRERLRFLAEALEQVGDKVVITDHEGRIEFVNEAFECITGFDEEEVLGETPKVLQSGLHDDAFYRELWDSILAGETFRAEIVNERKDGITYVEDETISPVVDEDGNVTHFVSTGRDVTGRKEREKELKEAKEEAERMNRLKSAFLANMSHEIRTPLTSILGFAEIIDEEVTGLDPSDVGVDLSVLSRYSGLIQKSGRRLMDTLEGVLDLSKLEAGEMNLSDEPIELTVEITELVDEFEPQAKDAEVDLQAEATERPVRVDADPGGVRMAIGNLVSNAIKYTPSGGSICVRVWEDGADACVEVEDTGIGMDPELVPELFEAFVQESEGMDREFEGSGLGLAVTKKVLDQLGASIEVDTEKGEGSRFTVRLPRAEE